MKKLIEILCVVFFLAGILFAGVGVMGVFMNDTVIKSEELMDSGRKAQVEILEKGAYTSGGGSSRSNRHEYFEVKYLGTSGDKEFTRIYTVLKEFEQYQEGDMISVVYDPADPTEAIIEKTPEQLKELKNKPLFIIFLGILMIVLSVSLGKFINK